MHSVPSGVHPGHQPTVGLIIIISLITSPCVSDTEVGGVYRSSARWDLARSPFVASSDVVVEPTGAVEIDAGAVVRFLPGVGVTVRGGRFTARGRESDPVVLTSSEDHVPRPPHPSLRLVDGPTPWQGRLQLFHRSHWRAVCTNSRNWTEPDRRVACRQLGYTGGQYDEWYPWLNGTRRLLYQTPGCTGTELRVQDCDWQRRAMGAGVCDEHADLAIRCEPVFSETRPLVHWRGLRFEHAAHTKRLTAGDMLYEKFSESRLYHVRVRHAGMGRSRQVHAAIESIGVPPQLYGVTVRDSAGGGINFTNPECLVSINNCSVVDNAGIGIYFNTSAGLVHVHNCHVSGNGGDGVRLVQHDTQIPRREVDGTPANDFCSSGTTEQQVYPIYTIAQQFITGYRPITCRKHFHATPGQVMTVNFLYVMNEFEDDARISFYDGMSTTSPLLGSFLVRNNTRPQSLVTTRHHLLVTFSARNQTRTEVHMEITAGIGKTHDLNVSSSVIADNNGRGIAIENLRSLVHVHRTIVANHSHVAGVHVLGGAGDVNVTWSQITGNHGDGINVTYAGGSQNVSWCDVRGNTGRGVSVWFNDTSEKIAFSQELVVSYSKISENLHQGVFVGNFCRPSFVNISGNTFSNGWGDALDLWSCQNYTDSTTPPLLLQIGHNRFISNRKLAVNMAPVANVAGRIENNYFAHQRVATLRIFSGDNPEVELLPVDLLVTENHFERNSGMYVVSLGASQFSRSPRQRILFTNNFLLNNRVSEPFPSLLPRNRVAAVVTVSSPSAIVYRNIIDNPNSRYELGIHFEDQSANANVSHNWLGHKRSIQVYNRIFDRKDRYNLAKADFEPFLLSENDPHSTLVSLNEQFVPSFGPNERGEIGGEIDGQVVLPEGTLTVTRDIFVRPTGRLTVAFGVRLLFPHAIGMMVAGHLHAEGSSLEPEKRITLSLLDRGMRSNVSLAPVRLVGGRSEREGRLQVQIDNEWGTVCRHGWSLLPAALACQQMGWVLNPDDWTLQPYEAPAGGADSRVLMSTVQCSHTDADLTRCQFEGAADIENTCTHDDDVTLRCYDVTWAGVRFGVPSQKNILKNVMIERAGLVDYSTSAFGPALRLDFNHHVLDSVILTKNDGDGLGIMYSDIYKIDDVNHFKRLQSTRNRGHGVTMRTLWLDMTNCKFEGNGGSGIHLNPSMTRHEQRELVRWVAMTPERKLLLPSAGSQVELELQKPVYLVTLGAAEKTEKIYHIRTARENVIGIQLLNPGAEESSEEVDIFDFYRIQPDVEVWRVGQDALVFPVSSSSYQMVLRYSAPGRTRGGVVLLLTAVRRSDVLNRRVTSLLRRMSIPGRVPSLRVFSSRLAHNRRGVTALHYSRYRGDFHELRLRKSNQSIEIYDSEIVNNAGEAVYSLSPHKELAPQDIAEVTFIINRTRIADNGAGIRQKNRDFRLSNNLFHWVLHNNTISSNNGGGLELSLPYVWQYNENFTHSIFVSSNKFTNNIDFRTAVEGHFARVLLTRNTFTENTSGGSLITISGMEKELLFSRNTIRRNHGTEMLTLLTDAQTSIIGNVSGEITHNQIRFNTPLLAPPSHQELDRNHPLRQTHVIAIKGFQSFNITDNVFGDNGMQYELLAGCRTASMNLQLDARRNWWGTSDPREIHQRIFDFDDWSGFAVVNFSPFLAEDYQGAPQKHEFSSDQEVDLNNLGGQLRRNLTLRWRSEPYAVLSDLVVPPGTTLRLEPGVQLEFAPSVGLLVLGTLYAMGSEERHIIMRPLSVLSRHRRAEGGAPALDQESSPAPPDELQPYVDDVAERVGSESARSHTDAPSVLPVRLCTDGNCSNSTGFLEMFNTTTVQWVPVCDAKFSERAAEVVCRQLGRSDASVHIARGQRVEYTELSLAWVTSWPAPIRCSGRERHLGECQPRETGRDFDHVYTCNWLDHFVYVDCGDPSRAVDPSMAWGGVRFAPASFESRDTYDRSLSAGGYRSVMRFVTIEGAGRLHGERSPAISTLHRTPDIRVVEVTSALDDGVTAISPRESLELLHVRVKGNLGIGVNTVMLTGEARSSEHSSFQSLLEAPLPYNLFGMLEACDAQKEVIVNERVLIYYKYDDIPIDCVKIFKSAGEVKILGLRLLQFHLVNTTDDPRLTPDHLALYDGDVWNVTGSRLLASLSAGSDPTQFHVTKEPTLSLVLHSGGGSRRHGFVAEVVTLPLSAIGFSREVRHNVSFSELSGNVGGAVSYVSAGEMSPMLTLEWNRITHNGRHMFGNFSTVRAAVSADVQNMQYMVFKNNLVRYNQGGVAILADSSGLATALRADIAYNVFSDNSNWWSLLAAGRRISPYQEAVVYGNYFTRANATYRNAIEFSQVVANFSFNLAHYNRGFHIMKVTGFERVHLPIYQSFTSNGFFENFATDPDNRSTIVVSGAGQKYVDNVLVNPDNDYEMCTVNRTQEELKISNYRYEMWRTPLDARKNWWGYNETLAIQGRIKDKLDDHGLLRIDFSNFYMNNFTLLSDKCPPGWTLVDSTCFLYVPAPMNFSEAKTFCKDDNASLPYLQRNTDQLIGYLRRSQPAYNWRLDRLWMLHLDIVHGCSVFVQRRVLTASCSLQLPFLCEMDPRVYADPLSWTRDAAVVGVLCGAAVALLLLTVLLLLWLLKSRHRRWERLQRRRSIRGSARSTRSLVNSGSDMSAGSRRRHTANHFIDGASSVASLEDKPSMDESDSVAYDARFTPQRSSHVYGAAQQLANPPDVVCAPAAARPASYRGGHYATSEPLSSTFRQDSMPEAYPPDNDRYSRQSYSLGIPYAGDDPYGDRNDTSGVDYVAYDPYGRRAAFQESLSLARPAASSSPVDPGSGGSDASASTVELKETSPAMRGADAELGPLYQNVGRVRRGASPSGWGLQSAASADPFPRSNSVESDEYFKHGRTRSQPLQPLETAM